MVLLVLNSCQCVVNSAKSEWSETHMVGSGWYICFLPQGSVKNKSANEVFKINGNCFFIPYIFVI